MANRSIRLLKINKMHMYYLCGFCRATFSQTDHILCR